MKKNEEREEFIVQNVTPGYHYISDLELSIGPLAVVDLTHKDPDKIKGSQNLKDSLRAGFLRKITKEAAEKVADRKAAKMRKDVTKLQQSSKTEQVQVGERSLEVEPLNISRSESSKMSEQVSTAGYANDPLSYAIALEIAQAQAEQMGDELSIEDFADMVTRDSELVRRLITSNTNAIQSQSSKGVDSAAYFAQPSDDGSSTVGRQRMKAPLTMGDDETDTGGAEVIDLTKE